MFRLRTFGTFGLIDPAGGNTPLPPHRLALLALVAAAGDRGIARDKLLAYLWPDSTPVKARASLEQMLHALRVSLGDRSALLGNPVRLEPSGVSSDVVEFRRTIDAGDLERAAGLYAGPFLDGFYLSGFPEFEQWLTAERSRLEAQYVSAIEKLAVQAAAHREHARASEWIQALGTVALPTTAPTRRFVEALVASGDRDAALEYVVLYSDRVRAELGVEPDPSIAGLAEELRGNTSAVSLQNTAGRVTRRAIALPPSRRARLAVVGLGALVLVSVGYWASRSSPGTPDGGSYPRTSIAILPFKDLSPDPAHAYFAGGLHDELLTQLAKVAALSVRGRASVIGYAGTTKSVPQIGEELQVGALLEASVQVAGGRLRVNVQLVDAAMNKYLWAESYDGTLDDAFAVQSDIAQRVVAALGAALGTMEQAALAVAPTRNAEAYRLYLQAVDYVRRPGYARQPWEAAQLLYERALALDSTFALAWAGLARVHGLIHWLRHDPAPQRVAAIRAAAEKALRFAPDLPEARLAMGRWHYNRRDFAAALREYQAALRTMPNSPLAVGLVGEVNRRLGNWDQVPPAFERAALLDPRDAWVFLELGCVSFLTVRRYAEALNACDEALRLAPDFHHAAVVKGWTHVIGYGALDSLRSAVHSMPPGAEAGSFGTRLAEHARLLFWERRPDSLLQVLGGAESVAFEGQIVYMPLSLYAGWAHRMRGDTGAATAAFHSALAVLDSAAGRLAGDWRVHSARGLALAALGRTREAVQEARWLRQSVVYQDRFWGPSFVGLHRAQILAQAGEVDLALDQIDDMLAGPSWTSVHTLRLDPLFDPLRNKPRFRSLITRHGSR